MWWRRSAVLVVAAVAAGCGSSDPPAGDAMLTVYISVPLGGDRGAGGTSVAAGADHALAAANGEAGGVQVRTRVVDTTAAGGVAAVAKTAREATEDSTTIAYIGELDSAGTFTSLPITNEARMLQISPTAGAVELVAPFDGSDEVPPETQPTGARTFGTLAALDGTERELGGEAMALVLDSIERADDPLDRASVVGAFLATGEVDGPLGPYEINDVGEAEPLNRD